MPLCVQRRHYWLVFLLWGLPWMESHSMCSCAWLPLSEWCWESHVAFLWLRYSIGWTPPLLMYPFTWGKTLSFPSFWVSHTKSVCEHSGPMWEPDYFAYLVLLSNCFQCSVKARSGMGSSKLSPDFPPCPWSDVPILLRMCCLTQLSDSITPNPTLVLTWKWKADT